MTLLGNYRKKAAYEAKFINQPGSPKVLVVLQGHNLFSVWCDHSGTHQTRIYPSMAGPVSMGMERDEEIGERKLPWDLLMRQSGAKLYTINKGETVQQATLIL